MSEAQRFYDDSMVALAAGVFPGAYHGAFCISCAYKTEDGHKCVIGQYIPDGHPGQTFAGEVSPLLEKYPELKEYIPKVSMSALRAAQAAHDSSCRVKGEDTIIFDGEMFKERLKEALCL